MTNVTIITQGPLDVALLQAILDLSDYEPKVSFVAAGGRSSADSLARSYLIHDDSVALVCDADTIDPALVEDRKRFLNESLGSIPTSAAWKVVVIDPTIDGLLFRDRKVIEALIGHPITDNDFLRGTFVPKVVLKELLPGNISVEALGGKLHKLDLSRIRQAAPIQELQEFITTSKNKGRKRERRIVSSASEY